jgi:hypothetical protein
MKPLIRFGRHLPIPSTVQILHELRVFSAEMNVRELCAEADSMPASASWEEISAHRLKANKTPNLRDATHIE